MSGTQALTLSLFDEPERAETLPPPTKNDLGSVLSVSVVKPIVKRPESCLREPGGMPLVPENAAMPRFARALRTTGYGDRLTTGGVFDARKCCRAANALLGKVVSDRPAPPADEFDWVTGGLQGRELTEPKVWLDRLALIGLLPSDSDPCGDERSQFSPVLSVKGVTS